MTTGLLTDQYEMTMVEAALTSPLANQPAVFEVFARSLPGDRKFGVVCGIERVIDAIENFRLSKTDSAWMKEKELLNDRTIEWLETYKFNGTVHGLKEGDFFLPNTPLLTIESTFAEGVLLETVILSILNHDCAVAAAAARMTLAAGGKKLIEAGTRRTHEQAAVASARSAYVAGFSVTSNLKAGELYGVPTGGTTAHAFTLAHQSEKEAFELQYATFKNATTYLVDTYDTETGIKTAVEVAKKVPAIRIDSGDLKEESIKARKLLDSLSNEDTKIIVSGDLDEYLLTDLKDAPIDEFLIGTSVVTGSGHPTAKLVYKLVEIEKKGTRTPVAKTSSGKKNTGGQKKVERTYKNGKFEEEQITLNGYGNAQTCYIENGTTILKPNTASARQNFKKMIDQLPKEMRTL